MTASIGTVSRVRRQSLPHGRPPWTDSILGTWLEARCGQRGGRGSRTRLDRLPCRGRDLRRVEPACRQCLFWRVGRRGVRPRFSASTDAVEQQLRTDLATVSAGCQRIESNSQQHTDLRPTEHKAIFGRVLVALGAPQGRKPESVDRLPAYVNWVAPEIRREFVRVYILNRGIELDGQNQIQLSERRPVEYLETLAELVHSVSGVDVSSGDRSIRIHADVLPMLDIALR